MSLQHLLEVGRRKVGVGDYPVWNSDAIVERLQPPRLLHRVLNANCGLHMNDALNVLESRLGNEVIRPVPLGAYRRVVAEKFVLLRPREEP